MLRPLLTIPSDLPAHCFIYNGPHDGIAERLDEVYDECQALIAAAANENRALTTEEQQRFDELNHEFEALEATAKAQASAEKMRPKAMRKTDPEGPGGSKRLTPSQPLAASQLRNLQRQPYTGRSSIELFGAPTERSPFNSIDEFFDIIVNNRFDPRMIRASSMSEGVESDGGFLVPTQYANEMLDQALEQSVLYGRVRVEPMTSNIKKIGTFYNADNSSSTPYGLTLQWQKEGGTWSESKAKTRQITLVTKKAGLYVPYSLELSEDSPNFAASLQMVCAQALGWGIDDAIINGTGAGQPLGILNSSCLISVAKESGQLADTLAFENLVNMFGRMHPASITNSLWLANPSTLPQLLLLAVPLGTGGQWAPALTNQSGVYNLLNRPLFLTEKCSKLGDKGDIILVDPTQYVLGLRRDITIGINPFIKYNTDEIVLKVTARLDGQPLASDAFTPKAGSSLAPFVTLDERA